VRNGATEEHPIGNDEGEWGEEEEYEDSQALFASGFRSVL
jgi:hypothetical protein